MSRRRAAARELVEELDRRAVEPGEPGKEFGAPAEQAEVRRVLRVRARATFLVAQRERRLRLVAAACAILFGLEAALSAGLAGAGDELLAVNSAVKAVVFSAICILAARDVRRFGRLLTLVIAGEALAVAGFAGAIALSGRVIPQDVVASAAEAEALAWAWTPAPRSWSSHSAGPEWSPGARRTASPTSWPWSSRRLRRWRTR